MFFVNKVELQGIVICEPQFDQTPNGTAVCKFLLETEDKFKNTTRKSIHNISCIGDLCDIVAKHCSKGSKARITGRIEYWADDKKNRLVDVRATFAEFEK